jgi:hypothetical protein
VTEVRVAFEPRRAQAKRSAREAPRRYPARIARTLALAHDLQRRLDAGEFADFADMARALGFTRARITQIMDLLLLAPRLQELLLFLETPFSEQPPSEQKLRHVVKTLDWQKQCRLFAEPEPTPTRAPTPLLVAERPRVMAESAPRTPP